MNSRFAMTTLVAMLLFGCASYEGTYSPGCIAHEGNRIILGDEHFVWEKFTDSVAVDDDGHVKNQFPGYPMQGSYSIEGQVLSLDTGTGDSLTKMYLQEYRNRVYLLTVEDFESWERSGTVSACALVAGGFAAIE